MTRNITVIIITFDVIFVIILVLLLFIVSVSYCTVFFRVIEPIVNVILGMKVLTTFLDVWIHYY